MMQLSPVTSSGPLAEAMETAASGMRAQALRVRVVSENLANADSTAATPGGNPYQRKMVTFEQAIDHATGAGIVQAGRITTDTTPFHTAYDPSHPAANAQGYVSMPNVSPAIEMADMREAERSYEANLSVIGQTRSMIGKTLDILKA